MKSSLAQHFRPSGSARRTTLSTQHFNWNLPEELKYCTGKGVKVAVIDSGIDLNSPMAKNVKAGIGIAWDGEKVLYHDDIKDANEHGTKICEIVLSHAPEVELYIARIFEKRLLTDMECLIAGMKWAIENDVNIINVSLGTTSCRDLGELKKCCVMAIQKKIFIISSLSNGNRRSYPGWFSGVLCVFNAESTNFRMTKNHLIGMRSSKNYCVANSFLVPEITSVTALFCEHKCDFDHQKILSRLKSIQSS